MPLTRADDLRAHSTFGRYHIDSLLGHGGLGAVYATHDPRDPTQRPLAIKVIAVAQDPSLPQRHVFEREIASSRLLRHPNILQVLDAGFIGTRAYIVTELITGWDLSRHTQRDQMLTAATVLWTCACVADALAHAHQQGIVHRDVKPHNILVDWPSKTVKLGDFGIASLGDTFSTLTGVVSGTPAYMAPEQLAAGAVGGAADLYSLGVVMFELLTGTRPHQATSLGDLLRRVANNDAPDLRTLRPDCPEPLAILVASLLERTPSRRPRDADAVAKALRAMLSSESDVAHFNPVGPKSHG